MPNQVVVVIAVFAIALFMYSNILFLLWLLISKYGTSYKGVLYGYIDDEYEGDNQVREQTYYILFTKDSQQYAICRSFSLGNRKIFDVNDRPHPLNTNVDIIIFKNLYVLKKPRL